MRNRPLMSVCLIVIITMSLCIHIGGAKIVKDLRPSALERELNDGTSIRIRGKVTDIEQKDTYQILYLYNNSIDYQNKSLKESKIIVYDKEKLNIKIGNQLDVTGEVSFFEKERNPGNFDQKLYYQKQGIHASVWASKVEVTEKHVDRFRQTLYKVRTSWAAYLTEVMGEEDGAILSAMLLAEKSGMDTDTKELYQANGVAHVLAISGLHLSIIGVGLYKIFRRLTGSYIIGGTAGIGFMILYIFMIGISVSVLRAMVMFLFRVGADMVGRQYDSPTALSGAAAITIVWKPLYLYDGGFWLSYGAILAIILVLPMFSELSAQGLWASVSINLITLPVLLYYFYEIPIYSVFLNMIVIPLMTAVLVCGLTGSFCCTLFIANEILGANGMGGLLLRICGVIFRVYEKGCELCLQLPGSRIVSGQPELWQIIIYYLSLILILVLWKEKVFHRRLTTILAVVLMSLSMSLLFISNTLRKSVSITVLDVGQGDCIFVRGPKGNTYLIDGGSSDVSSVGKYRIESFLKSQGVGKIDYVFVSHGDGDHISGIEEMIERMDIGVAIETIVFPDKGVWDESLTELAYTAMGKEIRVVEMKAGQMLREDELEFVCLAPASSEEDVLDSNASSMVLAVKYGEFDMLFTGDVEGKGEERLREEFKNDFSNVSWEALKAAHHGSKNSSAEEFLDVIKPAYAIVSAGRENSYGHPHEETIERLENVGSEVLSTQECGAITIVTDGEKMKVERYLKEI